jgi:hypothetical protein
MNTVFGQPSIRVQRTLGGSVYTHPQSEIRDRRIDVRIRMWTAPLPFELQGHFAPVASEELLKNQQPVLSAVHSRKRKLPVVKATGRPIVQAEIDDAFDD